MNKNEFYRQLMENYTVDTDKVRYRAKRQAHRGGTVSRPAKWIGIASAAVVALGVGTVTLSSVFGRSPVSVRSETDPETALARMIAAEENYDALPEDFEDVTEFYISFARPLSYNEATMAFSTLNDSENAGNTEFLIVYTADGRMIKSGEEGFTDVDNVSGVKIKAPVSLYKSIQELKMVNLVELAKDIGSDDAFVPLQQTPEITTTPPQNEQTGPIEIELPAVATEPEPPQSEEPVYTTTAVTEDTTPASETTTDTEPPEEPLPDKLTLPSQDVISVHFISEDGIAVLGTGSIQLLKITNNGADYALDTTYYASKPKISWQSGDGTQLFITACDQNGYRTKLYYADGASHSLTELDISAITADSELTGFYCNEKEGLVVFKVASLEKARIYTAKRDGSKLIINPIDLGVESDKPLNVLSYSAGELYYAETDAAAGAVTIFRKTGEVSEPVSCCTSEVKFNRSPSFDAFALQDIDGSGAPYSTIMVNGEFTPVNVTGELVFSDLNSCVFSDQSGSYCITASGVVPVSEAEAAAFDATPLESEKYTWEICENGTAYILKK